jgi:hypothetical protein
LRNAFSSVERLDRTLKQVAPVFKIAAPAASEVYTDRYLPPLKERVIHPWTAPVK